jgi:two-component system, chemotaxis family, sensor kinase CheA
MDDELFGEFLNESREHLANIEADLLTIEEGGAQTDEALVNKVFRAAHSIKGGSSFFGLTKIKELAHKAETVLDLMRSGKMTPNAEVTNVLLSAFDKLRDMINRPDDLETADISDLLVGLTGLASSYLDASEKQALTQEVALPDPVAGKSVTLAQVDVERARRCGQCIYKIDYDLIHDIEKQGLNVLHVFRDIGQTGEILDCSFDFEAAGTLDGPIGKQLPLRLVFASNLCRELIPQLLLISEDKVHLLFDPTKDKAPAAAETAAPPPPPAPAVEVAPPEPAVAAAPPIHAEEVPEPKHEPEPVGMSAPSNPRPTAVSSSTSNSSPAPADETLRVSVSLLEGLMNLAGELVLSRNQLRAAVAQNDTQALSVANQRLNQVTSELQDTIMRTRLQPIGNVFAKFPRVVRDMANSLHKEIQLDTRGKDVALDRSIIEALSDPLTHMVRNAVDHGIEAPEKRLRSGKKTMGTLVIEARHEAGQVVVDIADDGQGIDPGRVANAALSKGLITQEKLRGLSSQEKMALIFLPGLSTAEKVTDLSGRGVGMDVVKTNLERLGGKIEIKSELGKGSLFRIKLPLTLAIIPSLIVSIGKERFAIPQINVEELIHIRPEDIQKRIEVVGNAEVLLLRDQLIPLVHMDDVLDTAAVAEALGRQPEAAPAGTPATHALEVAVVTTGVTRYGMVVSTFHETEEIVVKPLGRNLKRLGHFAGATILGDGQVALILDVTGIAAQADLASVAESKRALEIAEQAERARLEDTHSLLLFHNAPDEVCATPLQTVLRVERVTPERIESVGGRRTMQYRGQSLPLVTLADVAPVKSLDESKDLAVIIANVHGREVGLVGSMPVDVAEVKAAMDQGTHRQRGIAGSAIIRDKTTLITDVSELVLTVYPDWAEAKVSAASTEPTSDKTMILVAEDSDFFRAQVKKYLEQDGFGVLDAPDGEAAWELLQQHSANVRAVVTDIEMPRLTGLELTQRIRSEERFGKLPIIALSSLAAEEDVARGRAAGVSDYLVKLDRDEMLSSLRNLIGQN